MSNHSVDRSEQQAEEFARISAREQRRLFLYIFSLLANAMDAEEVLQNTNLVLWSKFGNFAAGTDFFAWACRVAHFEVLKFRERRQRDALVFGVPFIDQIGAEVTAQAEVLERRHEALTDCLGKLREVDRKLILLRYSEGATTQSVASKLARPVKSIYAAVNRIRDALLECINRRLTAEERQ